MSSLRATEPRTGAPGCRRHQWCVVGLLTLHALLVAWAACRHSPTVDEVGHLPAGISHWKFRQFPLYKVNPPLVRMVAAVPVLLSNPELEWHAHFSDPFERPEFLIGREFIEINGLRTFQLFTWARWACLPFTLLGGYFCYRWAHALYGEAAGVLACAMWCFSPNIVAHAQLITPDVGATAVGLAACYSFRSWLNGPSWGRALLVGIMLGLTLLTKFTWIVLIPVWPTLWVRTDEEMPDASTESNFLTWRAFQCFVYSGTSGRQHFWSRS
jgi:hypothetical protein